jgi:hypothetical protein
MERWSRRVLGGASWVFGACVWASAIFGLCESDFCDFRVGGVWTGRLE